MSGAQTYAEPGPPAKRTTALPPPLVRPWRHPITWTRQHAVLLVVKAAFTYVGICAVAAVYYVLLETKVKLPGLGETNTQAWHRLVPGSALRHDIRSVAEGLFGGLLAIAITHNHYRHRRRANALDRTEIRLGIPNGKDDRKLSAWQLLYGLVLVPLYAVPGFLIGETLVHSIHPAVNHAIETQTGTLFANIKNNFLEAWPKKLIGLAAAFCFGHRPAKAVIDDLQLWFAERRVARGAPLRFYDTPGFKARYNDLRAAGGVQTVRSRGIALRAGVAVFALLTTVAAVYGYYVLNYIAKHHTLHL